MGLMDSLSSGLFGNPLQDIFGWWGANESNRDMIASTDANVDKQIRMQREFAKMGVRWRTEDAKAAGISPLAALGSNLINFQPVSAFYDKADTDKYLANLGQKIGGGLIKTRMEKLAEEKLEAETELIQAKKKQIENLSFPNVNTDGFGVVDHLGEKNKPQALGVDYQDKKIVKSWAIGVEAGVKPWLQASIEPDMSFRLFADPEILESMGEVVFDGILYNAEEFHRYASGFVGGKKFKSWEKGVKKALNRIPFDHNRFYVDYDPVYRKFKLKDKYPENKLKKSHGDQIPPANMPF